MSSLSLLMPARDPSPPRSSPSGSCCSSSSSSSSLSFSSSSLSSPPFAAQSRSRFQMLKEIALYSAEHCPRQPLPLRSALQIEELREIYQRAEHAPGNLTQRSVTALLDVLASALPDDYLLQTQRSHLVIQGPGSDTVFAHARCQTRNAPLGAYTVREGASSAVVSGSVRELDATHWICIDAGETGQAKAHCRDVVSALAKAANWKVLVSFRAPECWMSAGLAAAEQRCFGKVSDLRMGYKRLTAYFYLNPCFEPERAPTASAVRPSGCTVN